MFGRAKDSAKPFFPPPQAVPLTSFSGNRKASQNWPWVFPTRHLDVGGGANKNLNPNGKRTGAPTTESLRAATLLF